MVYSTHFSHRIVTNNRGEKRITRISHTIDLILSNFKIEESEYFKPTTVGHSIIWFRVLANVSYGIKYKPIIQNNKLNAIHDRIVVTNPKKTRQYILNEV